VPRPEVSASSIAVVEELLAGDLVPLDGIDADLFERHALAGGFGCHFKGEVDGELVWAVEEWAADFLGVDGVGGAPALGFLGDGGSVRRSRCRRLRRKRCPGRTWFA
jgi:hypothetical protein